MAREGLMDDCGFDFGPSEAEERAREEGSVEGYLQAISDMLEKIKREASCKNSIGDNIIHLTERHLEDIAAELEAGITE